MAHLGYGLDIVVFFPDQSFLTRIASCLRQLVPKESGTEGRLAGAGTRPGIASELMVAVDLSDGFWKTTEE